MIKKGAGVGVSPRVFPHGSSVGVTYGGLPSRPGAPILRLPREAGKKKGAGNGKKIKRERDRWR
ncbi:MAG: hypothetical protein IBX69_13125 [Anaerolineales bacterium]|nr:hypothetical protein [Anaerolineales bacterium]